MVIMQHNAMHARKDLIIEFIIVGTFKTNLEKPVLNTKSG